MTCRSSLTPDIPRSSGGGWCSAANVLRTWYTNVRVLQMCCELAAHSQHLAPVAALSQHQMSTSGNLSASRNVGVYWRVIPYNIYRIIKLLAWYTRTNSKNTRFAARSQHSSSERSTFAALQVVPAKIYWLEINNYVMIRLSVKSQRLTPNIHRDILILRSAFFIDNKKCIFVNGLSEPFNGRALPYPATKTLRAPCVGACYLELDSS